MANTGDEMQTPSKLNGPMAVARRPWKVATGRVLLLCGYAIVFAAVVGGVSMQIAIGAFGANVGPMAELISDLGSAVRDELGNGLAVAASIQFGVLIALVGRQIDAGSARDEMSLREALNYLAELPVILLAPAVVLVTGGVVADGGAGIGALLVILPVFAVQIGMAIVIATFELADPSTLAERSEEWAARAVDNLRTMNRLPAAPRRRFAAWVAIVTGAIFSVAVTPLVFWRPEEPEAILAVVLLAALMVVVTAAALLMIAAENSSLKPRKSLVAVIPIRLLYPALGGTMASIGLAGLFLYPPLGVAAILALALAVYCTGQSWREAKSVREKKQFDEYEWWRGGMIMRFGNRWGASEALASLRSTRATVERYRSKKACSA